MGVTWTREQKMVIDKRDDNILVSASAGSGKTAVLVRRILAYLTDPAERCDIDRLLVVTFTRAAAGEMKERIGRAIREALEADPDNAHLRRQETLIHNAQITTIDGFCSWLVRNYCYRTDLEPGFRVGEEGELKLLAADTMEEVLDAGYGAADPAFRERFRLLAETFATGKSDKALEEAISRTANAAESQPWPLLWLSECRKNNRAGSMEIMESLPWMRHFEEGADRKILEGLALSKENLELAQSPGGPSAYLATAQSYAGFFGELAATVALKGEGAATTANAAPTVAVEAKETVAVTASDAEPSSFTVSDAEKETASLYTLRQKLLTGFSPVPLGRKKAPAGENPELREVFKGRRDAMDGIRKQLLAMYAFSEDDAVANMLRNEGVLNTLLEVAELYLSIYAEKKRERHLVDFADLEHFALEILRGKPEGGGNSGLSAVAAGDASASGLGKTTGAGAVFGLFAEEGRILLGRTEVARELAGRFREVLVDEYQDSNDLQEAILTAVSRIEDGGRNYFCVGDVKQSIYGFRNAHPDLFMEKFGKYTPVSYEENPTGETSPQKQGSPTAGNEALAWTEGFLNRSHEKAMAGNDAQARTGGLSDTTHEKMMAQREASARDVGFAGQDATAGFTPTAYLENGRFVSPAQQGTRIDLLKNFRSRREVLDAANGIFRQIMIPEAGGVSYGDDAALVVGAAYPEEATNRFTAELLAVEVGEKDDEGENLLEDTGAAAKQELEARAIGERIRQMLRTEEIWDERAGQMRPVTCRDIVILLRTMQGWADTFARVLESMGIRAYSTARSGYFSALEVALMLDYLAIVDNPLQDIPLAAVLHSPIVGLSAEELAAVRGVFGSLAEDRSLALKSLWAAARAVAGRDCGQTAAGREDGQTAAEGDYGQTAAEGEYGQTAVGKDCGQTTGEGEEVRRKLIRFFDFYEEVRAFAPDTPLHELIWKIYNGTGYFDYASALPGGVQRAANLRMLAEKARDYEATSYVGLSAFIRYINHLKRYEVDLSAAGTVGENEDAVRIVSIHKSKGLEYPIVFVSGLGKSFNKMELSEKLLLDAADGLAADCTDPERRTVVPTIKREAVRQHLLQESVGEELRVLYVALTRAKQKLILAGTVKDEDTFEKLANLPLPLRTPTFGAGYVLGAKNAMELFIPAVRRLRQRAELERKRAELAWDAKETGQEGSGSRQDSEIAMVPLPPAATFSIGAGQTGIPGEAVFPLPGPDEVFREVLVKPSALVAEEVKETAFGEATLERLRGIRPDEVFDEEMREVLSDRLSWHYPYAGREKVPVKVSVSELKKGFAPDEDSTPVYEEPEIIPYEPAFIRERTASSATSGGAARGTAYHRVMELLRYGELSALTAGFEGQENEGSRTPTAAGFEGQDNEGSRTPVAADLEGRDSKGSQKPGPNFLTSEIRRQIHAFVEEGLMEEADAEAVDAADIAAFVKSELGARFVAAAGEGRLRREQPFAMEVAADTIRPDYPADETILVQGIIDAYFFEREGAGIVLVDYKTDRVRDIRELGERYRLQLAAYADALERATGLRVTEKIIWSFAKGRQLLL